jgi:hypothetical protein
VVTENVAAEWNGSREPPAFTKRKHDRQAARRRRQISPELQLRRKPTRRGTLEPLVRGDAGDRDAALA